VNVAGPADKAARQRFLRSSAWWTVPGTFAVLAAAYAALPPLLGMDEPAARLALAARWLLVALLPYAAVCLWILYARFAEGAHNPLLGEESMRLRAHGRVQQNTLEQLVWFALCMLALAALLDAERVRLLPIACTFFAVARFVYWWGYLRQDTLGRAPGVQLTFALNIFLLVHALGLFVRQLLR
jgi:uncharacterized membrane protein YecN with MAPEG domain